VELEFYKMCALCHLTCPVPASTGDGYSTTYFLYSVSQGIDPALSVTRHQLSCLGREVTRTRLATTIGDAGVVQTGNEKKRKKIQIEKET